MRAIIAGILRMTRRNGYPSPVPFRRLFGRAEPRPEDLQIGRVPPERRAAALASVLGTGAVASPGFERRAEDHGIDLNLLWEAVRGDRLEAAALLVPHPGRSGLLLASLPRDPAHGSVVAETARHLLVHASSTSRMRLAQALSSPAETLRSRAWVDAGLRHLASLDYMERPLAAPWPASRPLPDGVRLGPWDPTDRGPLERLLLATYEETLDCPGLAQMREPSDILDGHLAAGEHDPALWTIAWHRGIPVAALLLAPSAATESVEVVYLGIVPSFRGRGLGSALLSHGAGLVRTRRERTFALAVDARNTPAVALYARAGFRTVRRREAFVAPIPPYGPGGSAVK
jgi:ribosomal protein S18 acetylase RimI-like enzyme